MHANTNHTTVRTQQPIAGGSRILADQDHLLFTGALLPIEQMSDVDPSLGHDTPEVSGRKPSRRNTKDRRNDQL